MSNAICADFITRSIKCLLAFPHTENLCVQWFVRTFTSHAPEQLPSVRDQRNSTHFPILCAGRAITTHDKLTHVKNPGLIDARLAPRQPNAAGGRSAQFASRGCILAHFSNQGIELVSCRQ